MERGADYRPEIDGLRAIAVLSVIVFHLTPEALSGGFVGVDVFFVISGYLITGLIRRGAIRGDFRYAEFFVRRVRRLAPALIFATLCACVAGYFILLPADLASFGESVIAQPIAMQNLHFLAEGQYFEGSDLKPLLHTWSLGVEEQFYFLWPVVLVQLSRLGRRAVLIALGSLLVASFALNLALPIFSAKASFFLLPPRAWELGVGGLLAILEEGSTRRGAAPRAAAFGAGASLIVLASSFLWISEDMAFPGWVALVPVAATAGLIACLSIGDSPVNRVLSARPLVSVGLISYSLYLWHWPVIVFARHLGFDPTHLGTAAVLIVLSLGGAACSYHFVEKPVRKRRILSTTRALLVAAVSLGVGLITLGVLTIATDGLAFRYTGRTRAMLTAALDTDTDDRCGIVFRTLHPAATVCQFNDVAPSRGPGVLLWGNSHAAMWASLIAEIGEAESRPVYLSARNCRATTDSAFCGRQVQESVLSFVRSEGIEDVILASSWHGSYDIPDAQLEEQLEAVVREISSLGVRTWLVIDIPVGAALDPESRYRASTGDPTFGSVPEAEHRNGQHAVEMSLFDRLATSLPNVEIVDPTDDFCFEGRCWAGRGEEAWYRDTNHVTNTGARRARHRFERVFAAAAAQRDEPER